MRKSKHCTLCEHQVKNVTLGTLCGLTGRKPGFDTKCDTININQEKLFLNIIQTNVAVQLVAKNKKKVYSRSLLLGLTALICFILSVAFWELELEHDLNFLAASPIVAIGIGVLAISLAIRTFTSYQQKNEIASLKLQELNEVLLHYQFAYDIDLAFQPGIEGMTEIKSSTTLLKNHQVVATHQHEYASYIKQDRVEELNVKGLVEHL